ncbi:hypothetical protein ACKWTF_003411 [Chironomus riparius]
MGVLFNAVVSIGVGVATTALIAGTGPVGVAAALAIKGAEATAATYAIGSGVLAAGYTNVYLNTGRSSGPSLFPSFGNGSSGSSSSNLSSSLSGTSSSSGTNSSSGSSNSSGASSSTQSRSNNAGNTNNSNDPNRDQNERGSNNSGNNNDANTTDQDEDNWDSSDESDERNHRYKYIAKRYPGRSTYANPLEIDHTIPMAVWKELLKEIQKYAENDLPKHLKRALKIFRIILKGKDIFSLSAKDLDKLMKEFPAIEILKLIHRHQFSTGNKELRKNFNKLILDFILAGNWAGAIEYIFRDQINIARFFNVGQEEIENILNRQRSFVRYLLRKGILTEEEARRLLEIIGSLMN